MLVVDDREVREAQDHHSIYIPDQLSIPCTVKRLDAGDYAFLDRNSNPFGIERTEIGNLVQKLGSGELEEQLERCQEAYVNVILLIEGVYDKFGDLLAVHRVSDRGYYRVHIHPHTHYKYVKALEIRLSELGIEIIHSANFDCSMTIIQIIYNQRTKPEEEHSLFKKTRAIKIPTKFTRNPAVPRLMALCPRMNEKVAIRLIERYGTIWGIIQAGDNELMEIEGMGKTLIRRLKENVGFSGV